MAGVFMFGRKLAALTAIACGLLLAETLVTAPTQVGLRADEPPKVAAKKPTAARSSSASPKVLPVNREKSASQPSNVQSAQFEVQLPAPKVAPPEPAPVRDSPRGLPPIPETSDLPLPPPPASARRESPLPGATLKRMALIEFRGVSLGEAMKDFGEQSGLNIITSPEAAKVEITVYLRNVTAKDALDSVAKANELYYKIDEQSGIVRISTTKEYRKSLSEFQEERTEVFTLLYLNPYAVALAIRNTFGERVRMGVGDLQTDFDQTMDLTQRLQRFDLIESRNQGLGRSRTTASLAVERAINWVAGSAAADWVDSAGSVVDWGASVAISSADGRINSRNRRSHWRIFRPKRSSRLKPRSRPGRPIPKRCRASWRNTARRSLSR